MTLESVTVNNTYFNQSIKWNKLKSDQQTRVTQYIIKYGRSKAVQNYSNTDAQNRTSTTNSATLTLPLPKSPTTYNVWVAAVSNETGTGKYSEVLKINYTGNVWSIDSIIAQYTQDFIKVYIHIKESYNLFPEKYCILHNFLYL